jgi:HNH endonuclease
MSLTVKKRFQVLRRFKFKCVYCGRTPPEVALEVDHRVPRGANGSDDDDNLVAACRDCNRGKGLQLDDDDSEIVLVYKSNGEVDDVKSLKVNNLWDHISPEFKKRLIEGIPSEEEMLAFEEEMRVLRLSEFRRKSHAWFTRPGATVSTS